ncbi:MAG: PAS domain-containing protein [Planctomycetota bacterium]
MPVYNTTTPILTWASGPDQKYYIFNQAWLDFTGSHLQQNINDGWFQFIHPDDLAFYLKSSQAAFDTTNPFQVEFRLKRHDGFYRWFLCNAVPCPNPVGEFSGYIATNTEIHDLKEIEAKQKAIKERIELFLNCTNDGIWDWIDFKTNEQWWSPHFYELIGYQDQEIEPSLDTFKRLLHPDDLQRTIQAMDAALEKDVPFDLEYRLRVKGGEYHWFRGSAKVFRNLNGDAVRMSGSLSDIHARILAEEESKAARKQAEQAIKVKDAFLSMMCHEIRTPLTSILGFSEILLESCDDPDTMKAADIIHTNGEYLLNTINDFRDLSKIEDGQFDIEILECCPVTVIENAQALLKRKAVSQNLNFEIDYETALPETIKSDPIRLKQILLNIAGIAIRYTDQGSIKLSIKTTTEIDARHSLTFTLNIIGMGMTSELLNQLFSPCCLTDIEIPDYRIGTGLGLIISQRLIELLGGSISADQYDQSGTTIKFSIATGDASEVKMEKVSVTKRLEEIKASRSTQELVKEDCRILLVEDGIYNQRLINYLLTKAGAEINIVENGQLAIDDLLQSQAIGDPPGDSYDLILMDIQMPVLDGYATTRKLRSMGFTKPIIALTAHAMTHDRQRCLDAGCDEYLSKPIDRKRLISTINSVLKTRVRQNLVTR